jgi:hypothetical protein
MLSETSGDLEDVSEHPIRIPTARPRRPWCCASGGLRMQTTGRVYLGSGLSRDRPLRGRADLEFCPPGHPAKRPKRVCFLPVLRQRALRCFRRCSRLFHTCSEALAPSPKMVGLEAEVPTTCSGLRCLGSFAATPFTFPVRPGFSSPVSSEILVTTAFSAMAFDLLQICRTDAMCRATPPKTRYKMGCLAWRHRKGTVAPADF